jgi:hypothetical protein
MCIRHSSQFSIQGLKASVSLSFLDVSVFFRRIRRLFPRIRPALSGKPCFKTTARTLRLASFVLFVLSFALIIMITIIKLADTCLSSKSLNLSLSPKEI